MKKAGEWRGRVQASMISVRARLVSCSLRRLACLPACLPSQGPRAHGGREGQNHGRLAVARGRR